MRVFIGIVSAIGALICGAAFVISYLSPTAVESFAREVIRIELERRVGERVASLESTKVAELAVRMSGKNQAEAAALRRQIAAGIPRKVSEIAAQMLDADCECRKSIEKKMTGIFESRVIELTRVNERLEALIRTKYMDVATSLRREFRIFTGANALVFALLGITVLVRKRAGVHLVLPTLVLLGAAGLVAYLYLFNQNWLHSVVFNEYVGLGYFVYLGIAIAFLCDIAFNRARVTTELLNGVFQAVGSAVQVTPC